MCVIIAKKAAAEIPYDHIVSAAKTNSDGAGVAFADRGKIEMVRFFNPKGVDPEAIAKELEKAKGLPALLHFRYRTKGDLSLENCMPFHICTNKDDDTDIVFAHNGTLSGFNNSNLSQSDSSLFATSIVVPLFKRSLAFGVPPEKILGDALIKDILVMYAGGASKFTLMSGQGDYLIINKSDGVEMPYGWASNKYSLERHASANQNSTSIATTFTPKYKQGGSYSVVNSFHDADTIAVVNGAKEIRSIIHKALVAGESPPKWPAMAHRQTFIDAAGLHSIEDLSLMAPDELVTMCERFPYVAALAIMDLMEEWESSRDE